MADKRTIKGRTPVITPPDQWGWCCIVSEENGEEILTRNGNWKESPATDADLFFYASPEKCEAFVAGLSAPPEGPRIVAWEQPAGTSKSNGMASGRWLDIGQGKREEKSDGIPETN